MKKKNAVDAVNNTAVSDCFKPVTELTHKLYHIHFLNDLIT